MDFYERVAVACERIPYGRVASYGQIALLCGRPFHARQVGYALRRRLEGYAIPAHRVVNAQGYLSGAAAFDRPDTQRRLLEKEGVRIQEGKRVNLRLYGWYCTQEDVEALEEIFFARGI